MSQLKRPSKFPFLRLPAFVLFASVLALSMSMSYASTVPFFDDFTYADGTDLDGDNGWGVVGSGSAIATNNTAEIVDATMTNNFTDTQNEVWTDFQMIPVFGDDSTTNVPAGSAYAFYINTSSNVVAFDGTSTQILSTVVTAGAWTRFTVHSDYTAKTWDLYVDGALAADDLGFYDDGVADLDAFGIVAEGVATATTVDDVYITLSPSNAVQPDVSFAAASLSVNENIGVATGTVELAWAYAGTAEVDVVVFGGDATSGDDFGYTNLTVSFDPAETSKDFTFLVFDDSTGEQAETIVFALANYDESNAGSITNFTTTINVDPLDVPTVEFESATVSYNESDGAQLVTVALSAPNSLATATVHHVVLAAGTTATDPTDYTYTSGMISFNPGETNKTFSFTIQDDNDGESDETIVFGLQHFTNSLPGTVTNLTVTILEDPSDWTLPFVEDFEARTIGDLNGQNGWVAQDAEVQSGTKYAGSQAGSVTSATGYARHTFADAQTDVWTDIYVQPAFGDGSTTNPPAGSSFAFFVNTEGDVVVYNGSETQTVDTAVVENAWTRFTTHSDYANTNWALYLDGSLIAEDLTFYDTNATAYTEFGLISGEGVSNAPVDNVSITLTVPSSLQPKATFALAAISIDENIGVATGTVELAWAYDGTAEVDVVVFGGTAANGADYGFTNLTVSFDPLETSKDFNFLVYDDSTGEQAETIVFALANYDECSAGGTTNFTTTINVDPLDNPTVEFESATLSYDESDGVQLVTVALSAPNSLATATVHHVVLAAGTTATDPTDYTYTSGMITFIPGETNKTFSFEIQNDSEGESDETIVFALQHFTNSLPGTVTNLTVTILEDPNDWTLPFVEDFEARTIGDLDGQNGWIAQDAEVQSGTKYAGSQAGSVTSATGYARHTFADAQTDVWTELRVQPVFDGGDTTNPPAGSSFAFYVDENGDVVVYNGTATQIVDTAVIENAWTHFAVHSDYANTNWDLYLDGALIAEDLTFYDTNATAYSEFGLIAGEGVSNAPVDNISITLTVPSSVQPTASFVVTATNYEENVGIVTGYVALAWAYDGTAEVDVVAFGGTAINGSDYDYSTQTVSFNPGITSQSFTLTISNDVISEVAETIFLGFDNFSETRAGDTTNSTITIDIDPVDSAVPDVNFTVGAMAVAESIGTLTATVQLSSAYSGTVTVYHAVSAASTATSGQDYNGYTPGALTFLPSEQTKTFSFTILNDTSNEPAETIIFALSSITNASPIVPTNLTVTIGVDNGDWSLPFVETFEARTPGDLDGQYGWSAIDGIVQTVTTYAGSQAGGITSATGNVSHLFADAQTDVWTEIYIQPVFDGGATTNPPAGSTFAFYVNADGDTVVYDGTSTQIVSTAITEGSWANFVVHSDYTAKTWDLYLDGAIIAPALGFFDAGVTDFSEFGLISGAGSSNAPVDNITIDTLRPASLPPQVTFTVAGASYPESAGTVTGTVALSWASAAAVTADVVVVTGGTAVGGDHTFTTTTLSFAPGITNQTFAFDITDDASPEPDETLILGLANFITGLPGVLTNHTVTIESDVADWTLPFYETFESRTLGDLNGQQGWDAQDAVVQGSVTYDGSSKAGSVTSATGFAYHQFGDSQTEVWTDFYMQPVQGDSVPTNVPAGSTFVFYVNTDDNVVAFDGTNAVELTATSVPASTWARFTVHSDYATKTYKLYVNSVIPAVASGFGFYDAGVSAFSEFGWLGDANGDTTPMDDLAITLSRPTDFGRTVFMFK